MSNQTVAIHIDGVRHSVKPKTNLNKKTSRVQEVTPEQFKGVLTNGMTVCLAEFSTSYPWGEGAEFVQQQYFMLDFDNGYRILTNSYMSRILNRLIFSKIISNLS